MKLIWQKQFLLLISLLFFSMAIDALNISLWCNMFPLCICLVSFIIIMTNEQQNGEFYIFGLKYLESLAPFKKLYGATHFFRLVAPFSRLFGATQSFFVGGSI